MKIEVEWSHQSGTGCGRKGIRCVGAGKGTRTIPFPTAGNFLRPDTETNCTTTVALRPLPHFSPLNQSFKSITTKLIHSLQ